MWVIDNGCSTHICRNKQKFESIKETNGGCVRFGDNAKGKVTVVGTITLISSCDLLEVYLVEGLKHNHLTISQLFESGLQVTFNTVSFTIKQSDKSSHLFGDRVNIIYIFNIIDFHHSHVLL